MPELSPRTKQIALAVAGFLVLGLLWWAQGGAGDPASPSSSLTSTSSPAANSSGLAAIAVRDLPVEARATITLIEQGGPYPSRRDGVTFENRERILPQQPTGYYREYTVPTPGSDDRGARRIVVGRGGTMFYTSDHYDSFKRIEGP